MKSQNKKILLFFAIVIALSVLTVSVVSAFYPTGQCGENVFWSYDEVTGELVISGEGDMWNYNWDESPFYHSRIKNLNITEKITSVGESSFYGSELKSVQFSESVTDIGTSAFYGAVYLEELTIPDSIDRIGNGAFMFCESLKNVVLSKSLTNISKSLFYGCENLTDIEIPFGVTQIKGGAFGTCCNLESVLIPVTVERIDNAAFYCCEKLKYVYYCGSEEQWNDLEIDVDNECLTNAIIYFNFSDHNHEFETDILKEATCKDKGRVKRFCSCGCYYYEEADIVEHSLSFWTVEYSADCVTEGREIRKCIFDCGYVEYRHISTTEHKDDNGDNICDVCSEKLKADCSCNCHKGGFSGFIWKILRFFYKLFKINPTCACGVAHY